MGMTHEEFAHHFTAARTATADLAHHVDAARLYLDACRAAQARVPGPLGTAIAGVLAAAAYERTVHRCPACLCAAAVTDVALALAVLDHSLTEPPGRLG